MSGRQSGLSSAPAGRFVNMACPAARQAGCSLRTAALDAAPGRNGLKELLTECETDIFLSLARGHRIAVRDHETGALWRGNILSSAAQSSGDQCRIGFATLVGSF